MGEAVKEERNMGLTGLRGVLVLMTALGYHYETLFGVTPATTVFGKFGFDVAYVLGMTAPNLFFVMSGYLMYSRYRERIQEMSISAYLLPRMKKMYPLMIVTTLYLFILGNIENVLFGHYPLQYAGEEMRYTWKALILNLIGCQSGIFAEGDELSTNAASWFVAVLMICYVLFFLIIKLCKNNKKSEYLIYCIGGGVGMVCSYYPLRFPLLYRSSGRGLGYFFAGVLICIIIKETEKRKKEKPLFVISCLLMAAGIVIMFGNPAEMQVWPIFFVAPCLIYLLLKSVPLQNIFSFAPMIWVGNRSLSLFLWNMPILITFRWLDGWLDWKLDYGNWLTWLAVFGITLVITKLSYRIFEKWTPAIKRK